MKRYNITCEEEQGLGPMGSDTLTGRIQIDEAKNGEWVRYEDAFNTDHTRRDFGRPWIVCAANRNRKTRVIVTGARHFDKIMKGQIEAMASQAARASEENMVKWWHDEGWSSSEQGFIDQHGSFHDRENAWLIAEENGQVARITGSKGELFSEDLY